MKKIIEVWCIFLSACFLLVGCTEEELGVKLNLSSPVNGTEINDLVIPIQGSINRKKVQYFFYQAEDGHTYLGVGKINPAPDGRFETDIILTRQPSNDHIMVVFYLDEDNDGEFNVESETRKLIGGVTLVYKRSYLNKIEEEDNEEISIVQ